MTGAVLPPEGVTQGPHGLVYRSVTYRYVQDGQTMETSTVPAGGYEDTRLGMEALDGDSGWQVVDPNEQDDDEDAQGTPDRPDSGQADPEPELGAAAEPEPGPIQDDDDQEGGE